MSETHGNTFTAVYGEFRLRRGKHFPLEGSKVTGSFRRAETPEYAAEETEDAAQVRLGGVEAAEDQTQIAAVGLVHRWRGVSCRVHNLLDEAGEEFEPGGGCRGRRRGCWLGRGMEALRSGGELVEAEGDGLSEVDGGLLGMGGNVDEQVAVRQIFACETVFFRAEDQGNARAAGELALDDGGQIGQGDDGLLGLAVGEGSGAEGGVAEGLFEAVDADGVFEQLMGSDGGFCLVPVGRIG